MVVRRKADHPASACSIAAVFDPVRSLNIYTATVLIVQLTPLAARPGWHDHGAAPPGLQWQFFDRYAWEFPFGSPAFQFVTEALFLFDDPDLFILCRLHGWKRF